MNKYLLVYVDRTTGDEFIMNAYDILLINPQLIVDGCYSYMCLSDRQNTIVELRAMNDDDVNYNVLATMKYEKEAENFFLKEGENND